jgi:hypothetical protein
MFRAPCRRERMIPLIDRDPTRPENPFTPTAEDYLTAAVSTLARRQPLSAWQVVALSAIGAALPVAVLGAVAYHYAEAARTDLSEEIEDVYYIAQEAKWQARDASSDAEGVLSALARAESVPGDDPGAADSLQAVMPGGVMSEIRRLGLLGDVRYAEYDNTQWVFASPEVFHGLDADLRSLLEQAVHDRQITLVWDDR